MGASEVLDGGRAWVGDVGGGAEGVLREVFLWAHDLDEGRLRIRSLWLKVNKVSRDTLVMPRRWRADAELHNPFSTCDVAR